MGIFGRFRPADESRGRTYEGQQTRLSEDEQALARYRYMLKTAPPETIEQAHIEAFARLTSQQRQMLLEQLRAEMPGADGAYAKENPQTLARLATRAEVRQPGTMERLFTRVPAAAPGFGGMMAGSLFGSMAGLVDNFDALTEPRPAPACYTTSATSNSTGRWSSNSSSA